MAKRYARLNWQNKPSVATPINATNLNKMDKGIDDIDTALNNLENSIVGQIVNDPTKINNAAVNYSLKQSIDAINNNLAMKIDCEAIAAVDFNTLTTNKDYIINYTVVSETATLYHMPTNLRGTLSVRRGLYTVTQIYIDRDGALYIRAGNTATAGDYTNLVWSAWSTK